MTKKNNNNSQNQSRSRHCPPPTTIMPVSSREDQAWKLRKLRKLRKTHLVRAWALFSSCMFFMVGWVELSWVRTQLAIRSDFNGVTLCKIQDWSLKSLFVFFFQFLSGRCSEQNGRRRSQQSFTCQRQRQRQWKNESDEKSTNHRAESKLMALNDNETSVSIRALIVTKTYNYY